VISAHAGNPVPRELFVLAVGNDLDDAELYGPYSEDEAKAAADKVYTCWTEDDQPTVWVLPLKASVPL
jgi:hypothetical protein